MNKQQPIRVGIDLTSIWRRPTGIFRYSAELAKHLLQIAETEPGPRYVLFFARSIHPDFLPWRDTFDAVICPTTNELFIKQVWFPAILPRLHLHAMHYPAFPPPYIQLFGPQTLMTLHDAGPWRYAQALTLHGRLYFRTLLARGLHTCTRVITISEHARSEIAYFMGQRFAAKLVVIPEAAHPSFAVPSPEAQRQQLRDTYHLPERFLLTVATVEPRKNLVTLLVAYQQLRQRLGDRCPSLVIVGRKGWNCADILSYMQDLQEMVVFPGHVSDEELIALYQMTSVLIFPSLYEGFGLPLLEAMLAGCPIISSNTSSLPEVAGEAALFVDPLRAAEMAAAMEQLLMDETLRVRLVAAGRARAQQFSWQETARRTRAVYLEVALQHHVKKM